MGIWGPYSEADDRQYRRMDREHRARQERMRRMKERLPFRLETLDMVRAGEITLEEAKRLIKEKEATES